MAVTRLKRKDRRNKARAINKTNKIKQLTAVPVIKNIDIEQVKAEFTSKGKGKAEKSEATVKAEKSDAAAKEEKSEAKPAASKEESTEKE